MLTTLLLFLPQPQEDNHFLNGVFFNECETGQYEFKNKGQIKQKTQFPKTENKKQQENKQKTNDLLIVVQLSCYGTQFLVQS